MKAPLKHYIFVAGLLLAGVFILFLLLPLSVSVETENQSQEPEPENYLEEEEAVVVVEESTEGEKEEIILPVEPVFFKFIEVTDGCGPHFEGDCLNVRSGPGTEYDVQKRLRNGVILKVGGVVERGDRTWYKIVFDEKIRYPNRVQGDWYVAAEYVRVLLDEGHRDLDVSEEATTTKRIIVDRSDQTLYAYENNELFMEKPVSTGALLTPTPRGEFTIFRKTPSRYMQGPLPGISDDYYDLPGVPWNLYFTKQGAVIHGAYWHNKFGEPWSHGCVNVPLDNAQKLYRWADLGTKVIVRD